MAMRSAMLKCIGRKGDCALGSTRRWAHAAAQPTPLQTAINIASQPLVLPEDQNDNRIGAELPNLPFNDEYMELMAVPKRKVTPHKRGIRNGPRALKPVPVIIRCKACGRVKLPHFFCCRGIKQNPGEQNS